MAVESEIEAKFELPDSGEWERLRALLGPSEGERVFSNRYFGVEPAPRRRDWVLRLRLSPEGAVLTLKIGAEVEPGLYQALEYSEPVDPEGVGWEETGPVRRFRAEISSRPLVCLGEVENRRLVFRTPIEGFRSWELDRTRFPDGSILYELETELLGGAIAGGNPTGLVEEWLANGGVRFRRSRTTKFARFLEAVTDAAHQGPPRGES